MQDFIDCPICGDKMRTINLKNKFIHSINKKSDFYERICAGLNHSIQIFTDKKSSNIDLIKVSLSHDYDKFLIIDFYNEKCQILCLKNNINQIIDIPRLLIPDFPNLTDIKEKIKLLLTFS